MKVKIYKNNVFAGDIADVLNFANFLQDFILSKTPVLCYPDGATAETIINDNPDVFSGDHAAELRQALQIFHENHGGGAFIIYYDETTAEIQIIRDQRGASIYAAVADALDYGFELHKIL